MGRVDVTCPICGANGAREAPLETKVARPRFAGSIVTCVHCGVKFVWPTPSRDLVSTYYADGFEAEYVRLGMDFTGGRDEVPEYLKSRLRVIEGMVKRGSLLDIGAGVGAFVRFCIDSGWDAIGTEIDTRALEYAHVMHGVSLFKGDLLELAFASKAFDVVHLNHVLEHLPDPTRVLREIHRVTKTGGLLVAEVPHEFADLVWMLRRTVRRIREFAIPTPHLYFYTPHALRELLTNAGFRPVRLYTYRRDYDHGGVLKSMFLRTLDLPERRLNRGPLIVAMAQKVAKSQSQDRQ